MEEVQCKFGVSTCLLYVGFCEVDGLLWRAPHKGQYVLGSLA